MDDLVSVSAPETGAPAQVIKCSHRAFQHCPGIVSSEAKPVSYQRQTARNMGFFQLRYNVMGISSSNKCLPLTWMSTFTDDYAVTGLVTRILFLLYQMINYIDRPILMLWWQLQRSIPAENGHGCGRQLENCMAIEVRDYFDNSLTTAQGPAVRIRPACFWGAGRKAGRWRTVAASVHHWSLPPWGFEANCNAVQRLCLETVLSRGKEKEEARTSSHSERVQQSFGFVLSRGLMVCCLSSSSVFRRFCSFRK